MFVNMLGLINVSFYHKMRFSTNPNNNSLSIKILANKMLFAIININWMLFSTEAVSKCSILFKIKEGENFNHRNTLSISRIKI